MYNMFIYLLKLNVKNIFVILEIKKKIFLGLYIYFFLGGGVDGVIYNFWFKFFFYLIYYFFDFINFFGLIY